MQHDLVIGLVVCSSIVGFCFGVCVAKWAMRGIIRKYELMLNRIYNPFIDNS